ncbi:MAG: aspartate/glutamate racemase family protein [Kiloniellales bacterium]|nr:aspartate/glutamate racemase family protein [Kiloniellales bacterium]
MPHLALLHTGEAHVGAFADLFEEILPEAMLSHLVREDLLLRAQLAGELPPDVAAETAESLQELAGQGARVLLCTCSTLGPAVEAAAAEIAVPVLRVDRPMAEAAVAAGGRLLVVAALESTLAPTQALLRDAAADLGREVSLEVLSLPEAWEAFESGDRDDYLQQIADAVRSAVGAAGTRNGTGGFDAVVLAQASMAGAADRLADLGTPVLASPRLAVERAAELYRRSAG